MRKTRQITVLLVLALFVWPVQAEGAS